MTGEAKEEVEKFLRSGDRPGAIQYLTDTFNISSKDAEVLVVALEQESSVTSIPGSEPANPAPTTTLDGPLKAEVAQLLQTDRKLDAVKHVRKHLHVGLKEALIMVGEVARETNPNYVSFDLTGCLQMVAKGIGIFLMVCSLVFISAAAIIYFVQEQSIAGSDEVTGRVTAMQPADHGGTAPVIEYDWRGKKQSYQSPNYASPPDYYVGQTVTLFIHREEPDEITINSFADRYALIVGLGVPGTVLLIVSIVFLYFGRRKF